MCEQDQEAHLPVSELQARDGDESPLRLAGLVDVPLMQSMMDDFYALTRIPMSLIELDGTVVVGAGWQDVCVKFHRANPDTCKYCVESDTVLTADIPPGEIRLYKCRNGMWDAATPIMVGETHAGNLFTGQFFFDDEMLDADFFKAQAHEHGFEVDDYTKAIEAVPRLSRSTVDTGLRFLTKLSRMISDLSFSNAEKTSAQARLQQALTTEVHLSKELRAERGILQTVMENTDAHLAYLDANFNFVAVNSTYAAGSGHRKEDLIGRNHFELFPNDENEAIFRRVRQTREAVEFRAKPFEFPDQPWRGVTYWDWRLTPVEDEAGRLQGFAFSLVDVTRVTRATRSSEALNRLNDVIHSSLDFDEIIRIVLPELATGVGCEAVAVAVRSQPSEWRVVDVLGVSERLKEGVYSDEELPASMAALEAEQPVVFASEDDLPLTRGLAHKAGVKSIMTAPLSLPDGELGVLVFGYLSGPGAFDDEQVDFARKASASLSLALSNSRLFEDQHEEARLAASLADVDAIIHSSLAFEEIADRALGEGAKALGAETGAILVREDGEWVARFAHGYPSAFIGTRLTDAQVPHGAMAASQFQVISVDDVGSDPRVNDEVTRAFGAQSVIVAPLVVRGEVIATIYYNFHSAPHRFTSREVELVGKVASSLSLAMENAMLYEMERDIADMLQEALVAMPDAVSGIEFSHAYHSATEAARVGGDFYDLFELNEDHLGVLIGDVAGKGLNAAVLTSMVKNTVRAHANEEGKTPARILELTNNVIYRSTPSESFVTVFFGMLDCRNGSFVYGNAGHTAAALVRPGGSVAMLRATGPLLGAFADARFEQAETRLDIAELLFLYTDGLTEARGDGELYGDERLAKLLASSADGSTADVVREVIGDVVSFARHTLRDDLAILAVRRVPPGQGTPRQGKLEL